MVFRATTTDRDLLPRLLAAGDDLDPEIAEIGPGGAGGSPSTDPVGRAGAAAFPAGKPAPATGPAQGRAQPERCPVRTADRAPRVVLTARRRSG